MTTSEVKKRLYIGGLAQSVSEDELKKRFELFLTVSNVNLKSQTDSEGNHIKTFAHLSVEGTEAGLKKCYNAYQNAKWKGSVMKLEDAKESFIDRLAVEREEGINKPEEPTKGKSKKNKIEEWKPPEFEKLNVAPVPGTPIPGKKDWVVGKYGRVLPVLNVKKSYVTKAIKHDPSKFCHATKVFKDDVRDDTKLSKVNCDTLTWDIDEPDSEITKKRKGEFPTDPKPKKTKPFPAEILASSTEEYFSKIFPRKKENIAKMSGKEEKIGKSSGKENFSSNSQHSTDNDDDCNDSGDGLVHDDEMEIVQVGGNEQSTNKPAARSRFDSDYESDGDDDDTKKTTKINNNINSPAAKSSKKKDNSKRSSGVSNKKVNSPKKAQPSVSSSDEDDSDSEKDISEFKGIGSLITKSVQSPSNKKTPKKDKASSAHHEKAVCNGNIKSDDGASDEEVDIKKSGSNSTRKNKRKLEVNSPPEQPLNKKAKQSGAGQETPLKPNYLLTAQKDPSLHAEILSEFVAKAPKKSNPSRQKHDPYDSDLDSDNFEMVARKLAKQAGVKTTQEKTRKEDDGHLKALVDDCFKTSEQRGIASLMRDIAGGYSGNRISTVAETKNPSSKQEKTDNTKHQQSKEVPVKQRKDLVQSASKNVDKPSKDNGVSNVKAKSKAATKITLPEDKKDTKSSKTSTSDSDEEDESDGEDSSEDDEDAGDVKGKVPAIKATSSTDKKDVSLSKKAPNGDDESEDDDDESEDDDESDADSSEDDEEASDVKGKMPASKAAASKDKKDTSSSKKNTGDSDDEEDESEDEESDDDSSSDDDEEASDVKGKVPAAKVTSAKDKKDTSSSNRKTNDKEEDEDESDEDEDEDESDEDESDDDSSEDAEDVKGKVPATKAPSSKDKKDTTSSKMPTNDKDDDESEDDSSADDTSDVNGKSLEAELDGPEDLEISLAEEKKRNLQVLESVVGKTKVDVLTAKLKRNNVQIMDMNQLRFDPTKLKSPQSKQKETKKAKASSEKPVKQEKSISKETPMEEELTMQDKKQKKESSEESTVKSEVTMSDSLMNMLRTEAQSGGGDEMECDVESSTSFSLLDIFDEQKDGRGSNKKAKKTETQSPVKPLSGLRMPPKLKKDTPVKSQDKDSNDSENPLNHNDSIDNNKGGEGVNTKRKQSKDKALMNDAVTHKDEAGKSNVKKSKGALDKALKDAGKVNVRFSKAEWEERNRQIRQDILKICKSRNNYALRKKRNEEEHEKHKAVRKFGSWKKK